MKNTNLLFVVLAVTGLTTYSCTQNKNTSTGNPLISLNMTGGAAPATASLPKNKLWWLIDSALAFSPPPTMNDLNNNAISLSEFWINIAEIEFKMSETPSSGEVDGSNIEFSGPYLINLFNTSPTALVSGEMAQNVVRRIKYKTKKVSGVSAGNPAGMANASLYLTGTAAGNNFTLAMGEEVTFETAGANSVTFNTNDNLLLQVQTAEIIRNINLSALTNGAIISETNKISASNPCPVIDASANDLYTCFIKAFQKKTKFGKDVNGDDSFNTGDETVN